MLFRILKYKITKVKFRRDFNFYEFIYFRVLSNQNIADIQCMKAKSKVYKMRLQSVVKIPERFKRRNLQSNKYF